ncbi:hypothetical protein GP486_005954 [Trichoglossum hirsutum]|uniref:Uncharacterized protein n=1 Tax=Trichoglossum hirsutum TaxID=265104 RepID=A0A9P8L896_9PEZI|nr:hypothetical protein GP486_005954 [Trichoglossum hirsutum]
MTSRPTYQDLMPPTAIENEYGRFRGALQRGHASLDFRLRESTVMQDNVLKLLKQLQDDLAESISVVSGERLPYEQQSRPTDLSEDDYPSSSSEDGGSDNQMTELQIHLSSIRDILNHLNKLSFKIRNPALRPKSLKATLYREMVGVGGEEEEIVGSVNMGGEARRRVAEWLELLGDTGVAIEKLGGESSGRGKTFLSPAYPTEDSREMEVDIFDEYAKFDLLHMAELFRSFGILALPDQPPKNMKLYERLTRAITARRRQIRYWNRHADKLAAGPSDIHIRPKVASQPQRPESPREDCDQAEEISAQRSAPIVAPTIYPDTEVTAIYDKKLDDVLDSQSVVSYASTAWDVQGRGVELPPPPREAAIGNDFVRNIASTIGLCSVY